MRRDLWGGSIRIKARAGALAGSGKGRIGFIDDPIFIDGQHSWSREQGLRRSGPNPLVRTASLVG
jgi:hypothetical protein